MNTEILAILDASGSMTPLTEATIENFNKFIDEQKQVPGEAKVTLNTFNSPGCLRTVIYAQDLKDVRKINRHDYMPQGTTALYDAIGLTLETCGQRIAKEAWADMVILFIATDGEENASTEYTHQRILDMIQHAEKHGWKIIFSGANIDAKKTARSVGITGQSMRYAATQQGTRSMYSTVSASVASLRQGGGYVDADSLKKRLTPA